ncbi:MAG TPA: hypothetical protein PK829_13615 [Promineifilum sp.]|nr:hypothetical protein [Promineifilum sp.]
MVDQKKQEALAALFRETISAHHDAYIEADGADADWPIWYAGYLRDRLAELLPADFTKSELVYLLITLDRELKTRAPGAEWVGYYTRWFMERYG